MTDEALHFIEAHRAQPFFLYPIVGCGFGKKRKLSPVAS